MLVKRLAAPYDTFYACLFILFFLFSNNIYARSTADADSIYNYLWPQLEKRLIDKTPDNNFDQVIQLAHNVCENNAVKLVVFDRVILAFEAQFNLPAAILIGEELVQLANATSKFETEAETHMNLHRYYLAVGDTELATEHLQSAQGLFEKLNDDKGILRCKMYALIDSRSFRDYESITEAMSALLLEPQNSSDNESIWFINFYIAQLSLEVGDLLKAEKSVLALEQSFLADSTNETPPPTRIRLWRAELEFAKGNILQAEKFYLKTINNCKLKTDLWVEIYALQHLSEIAIIKNDYENAQSILLKSRQQAIKLEAPDLIATNYLIESKIAQLQNRYKDAFTFLEKYHFYNDQFNSKDKNFDLYNHHLEIQKERLTSEYERSKLELALNKSQLNYSLIFLFFILFIASLLFTAFRKNRKNNKRLIFQNRLIMQQSAELQEMDRAKSRFFANISHELRTPLTLVTSPIKTLIASEDLTKQQHKLLEIANQSGKQLENLINEILDLKKLESGKLKLKLQPTELSSFFTNYISQFESLAEQKEISFCFNNHLSADVVATIDREKWRQIVLNLISNAFKFTPKGGEITVETRVENNQIKFIVADTGTGIDNSELPKIFDLYFQSENEQSNSAGGTGIGLTICHEYAQIFGGDLGVKSTIGEGSTFTFSAPFILASHADKLSNTKASLLETPILHFLQDKTKHPHKRNKPTILLVEDNIALQDYISYILHESFNVYVASNGQEALEQLPSLNKVNLIISDLMMPVMDGYRLIEELKKEDKTSAIPVIMLTARNEMDTRLKALRFGVDDYMTKPFDDRELLVRIANLLKNQEVRLTKEDSESAEEVLRYSTEEKEWVIHFENYIRQNLANHALNIPAIASEFAMSESSLLRKTKRLIGLTPVQYLQEMRLDIAREMLENRTHTSIKMVAAKAGYKDERTFSRSYKKRFGKSPSEY